MYSSTINTFYSQGENYADFLENLLPELLEDVPLTQRKSMYFQQDGAPPHVYRRVTRYLNEYYPERWIAQYGSIRWPARYKHTKLKYIITKEVKRKKKYVNNVI